MKEEIKKLWETKGKEMELTFHKSGRGDWRWNERWDEAKSELTKVFNFNFEEFADGKILDIGCGPRSMGEWWAAKNKYGIEPLADEYKEINAHRINSFNILDKIYVQPAEQYIKYLKNKIDFVWSHNNLDHCYCWETVLENIDKYLKVGGTVYIGTDAGKAPNPNHPGIESVDKFINKINELGWTIKFRHDKTETDSVWIRTIGIIATK